MKILIDIPEDEYKNLAYANHFKLRSYIENGKVLPKGHGRLIDADAIKIDYYGEWNGLYVTEDTYKKVL